MKKEYKNMIKAVLLSVGILIVSMLMGCLYYYQPDDYLMNYISSGGFGNGPDSYLVFINILFGKIVKCFYQMVPTINWFGILYVVATGFIFFSIYYLFFEFENNFTAIIIISVLEFGTMVFLTFTVIAYMAMGAFWTYMIYLLTSERETHIELEKYMFMFLLLIIGIGFRTGRNVLFSSLVVFAPIFIFKFSELKINRIKWTVLVVMLVCLFVQTYNTFSYQQDEFWCDYKRYNSARSAVLDSKEIDYEQARRQLEEINFSENDLLCLKNWIFADKETYSLERLKLLNNINSNIEKWECNPIKLAKNMIIQKYNYLFIAFILCFWVNSMTLKKKCEIGSVTLASLLLVLMLYIRNRPVERVIISIYFLGIIAVLFCFYRDEKISKKISLRNIVSKCVLVVLVIVIVISLGNRACENRKNKEDTFKKSSEALEYMKHNKDVLFVGSPATLNPICYCVPIFDIDIFLNENILKLGSWDIYSTRYYDQVKRYELFDKNNVLISLINADNIMYVIDDENISQKDMIIRYIEEHTGLKTHFLLVERSEDGISFYTLKDAN